MMSLVENIKWAAVESSFQRIAIALVVACSLIGANFASAQEPADDSALRIAQAAEGGPDGGADGVSETVAPETAEPGTAATGGAAPADTADQSGATAQEDLAEQETGPSGWQELALFAMVIGLFIVPMYLGKLFSTSLRMPDHGWKFAVAMGTLAAAAVIYSQGELKFGPDLSGGSTLIFELDQSVANTQDMSDAEISDLVDRTIAALANRVDPSGTKEVTIRKYGAQQIEIIIPRVDKQELAYIERSIYTAGILEFRITASPLFSRHREIIELANKMPLGKNTLSIEGKKVAQWMPYNLDEFGPIEEELDYLVKRLAGQLPQALVLYDDGLDVIGDYLDSAKASNDQTGRPSVAFAFDSRGAYLFGQLTGNHVPNPSGQQYHLGIVLDSKLLSAPSIRSKITSQGEISGNMGQDGVDFIVDILQAGSLPAQLSKEPISRETISPTLGAETVEKGKKAILYSLCAVMVFMLIYYRFAGLVACFALGANLLLILGLMVLFKAAFTLPGLAGLVLTIGISVDANVLIFERIREERKRGAAMRMAIRNGFGRATQTIVDANVTTLITAVVIYKIAPDNVKGFGVTLIIGILMSMYSAIFLSRIIFDVAEKARGLKELGMAQLVGQTGINFLGKRTLTTLLSLIVISIGLTAVNSRRWDLLNIDFTGGSSVTMVLKNDQKMSYSEVKDLLEQQPELEEKNLSLVEVGKTSTRYTVSCVEQDVAKLQQVLTSAFGDRLQTYQIDVNNISSLTAQEDLFVGGTESQLIFQQGGVEAGVLIGHDAVEQLVREALQATSLGDPALEVSHPDHVIGSARRFSDWTVKLALPEDEARKVFTELKSATASQPVFPLANKIGGRVASDMKTKAVAAILISLLGIVAYIWFRFQRVEYGLAAVVALVHDVLVTLGMIALSAVVVNNVPVLANALMIEKFQISLPIVAAFLTIIGYSLNDTIVVFDRIREVKGKSPKLTAETINTSINQTLSRTLLTSMTTLLSVILLYVLGGDGIHGFAYSLVIGVIVGTYSSIFIASPALLWMSKRAEAIRPKARGRAA